MEIRNINQFQNKALPKGAGKAESGNAAYQNITDSYKHSDKKDAAPPDLKTAAELLLKKDDRQLIDLWENDQDGIVYAANSSRVVLGGYDTEITAVDPGNGELKWKSERKGFVKEGKDGTLYVSGQENTLRALDPKTGKDVWHKDFKDDIDIFEIGDDGTIYAQTGGNVVSIDPNSHEVKNECKVVGDPVMGKNGMVFGGGPDANRVTAYDFKTGEKKWEIPTEGMVRCAPAVGKDGTVYVGEAGSGNMIALDPDTGKKKWEFKTVSHIVASPAVGPDGTVYVGSCDYSLYAVNPDTGKEKWSFKSNNDFRETVGFAPDGSVLANNGRNVYALNPQTGNPRWSKGGKSYIYGPPKVGSRGRLYFGTNGRGMHCIKDSLMDRKGISSEFSKSKKDLMEDLKIRQGKGFVDVGGVRLRVNK